MLLLRLGDGLRASPRTRTSQQVQPPPLPLLLQAVLPGGTQAGRLGAQRHKKLQPAQWRPVLSCPHPLIHRRRASWRAATLSAGTVQ